MYATPTQGLHSPNPETFTSTRRQTTASRTARHLESPGNPDGPPLSPEVRDQETLFPACTEEVYLGPPLCYSVSLTKKPRRLLTETDTRSRSDPERPWSEGTPSSPDVSPRPSPLLQDSSLSSTSVSSDCRSLQGAPDTPSAIFNEAAAERQGEDPYLLCDVAESVSTPREERSRNEGPSYLNPRARVTQIDSSAAAECSPHTKALESNMGTVMTKISVCGSATNPSKEPLATATHINPKINRSPMRAADTEEEQGARRRDGGRRRRSRSRQEAAPGQVGVPGNSLIRDLRVLV